MAEYTVYLTAYANGSVRVTVPDDMDEDEARDKVINEAFEQMPRDVCAQCSGWGQKWTLEISDWDVATEQDGSEIAPERTG